MPDLKFKQLQYESDTWKRLLGFMMDENVHLKNRLSEVLKEEFDNSLLDELDNFQNRFVKVDELISLLRNDVAAFDKLFVSERAKDEKFLHEINRELKKLRSNLLSADNMFGKLKLEFTSYLTENIVNEKNGNRKATWQNQISTR